MTTTPERKLSRSISMGIAAGISLLAFYALTMWVLTRSWMAVTSQFRALWWLMVPLAASFGAQVGIYTILRKNRSAMVGGGTSAGLGMVACCAHHIADVLPILGLSTLAVILADYQVELLGLSLVANLVGLTFMVRALLRQPLSLRQQAYL